MQKAIVLIVLLFYSTLDSSRYIKTLFEQQIVHGNVNEITEIELTPKSDGTKTDSSIIKTTYDKSGNTLDETFIHISHHSPNVDLFDANGNKVKKRRSKSVSVFKYTTRYNNYAERVTICKAYGTQEDFKFEKNGLLLTSSKYQTDGRLTRKGLYKYDNKNRLVTLKFISDKDSLYEYITYKYDDKNLIAERSDYYDRDSLQSKFVYKYLVFDKLGNWTKRKQEEIYKDYTSNKIVIRRIKYSRK
jgi:hypothetical protein